MTNAEIVLGTALVCLSIALTIVSVKLYKHERHFHNIQDILTMIGMKMASMDRDIKEKEKVNV
jgi:hypothetical protein